VIGRNTADPARWKRYRGGTAGHLWVDATGSGDFRRLPLPGNVTCPMWLGERLWFLTDHEGTGNLYSLRADGSGLTRHTDHDEPYARHAATDGRRIVYQCAAELWLRPRRLGRPAARHRGAGRAHADAPRRFVPRPIWAASRCTRRATAVAMDVRGQLVTFRALGRRGAPAWSADGARYRHGQWLADGRTLVVVSRMPTTRARTRSTSNAPARRRVGRALAGGIGRVSSSCAPRRAAPCVALANHRNELLGGDTGSGQLKRADHSEAGRIDELAWSPCGGWLAYACWTSGRHRVIKPARNGQRPGQHPSPPASSTTGRPPSTRTAATCTSCRTAPSTRSTTACSSS
jgi:tricorn protease